MRELEDSQGDVFASANQSAVPDHDETPNNIFTPPQPVRQSTSNQRNMKKQVLEKVGKVFGKAGADLQGETYYNFNNIDSPPMPIVPNQSFQQQFPTPREWPLPPKNVTINSDLNEEYTLSPNVSFFSFKQFYISNFSLQTMLRSIHQLIDPRNSFIVKFHRNPPRPHKTALYGVKI